MQDPGSDHAAERGDPSVDHGEVVLGRITASPEPPGCLDCGDDTGHSDDQRLEEVDCGLDRRIAEMEAIIVGALGKSGDLQCQDGSREADQRVDPVEEDRIRAGPQREHEGKNDET